MAEMMEQVVRIGRQAALAAGAVQRLSYLKPHRILLKGDIDPVTEADLRCQELIISLIRQVFPDHGFLAEESLGEGAPPRPLPQSPMVSHGPEKAEPEVLLSPAPVKGWEGGLGGGQGAALPGPPLKISSSSPYRWIIDPLDGTVNFAHGFPMFCVSIAFEAEGKVAYGVIYDPLRDELFEAQAGAGARLNGEPIRVSGARRLDRALVATGFPYDIRERLPQTIARMERILGVVQGLRRAGSAALDMGYVACGRFDAFYEENLKPWDTAAGLLLIEEAGGRITTFQGGPYNIYSPNLAASNGLLHEQFLGFLRD
jgi:myo-inositol-1(or 4)-monophosphatase